MITSILRHLKTQTIGILALAVALGGTSYAAINLPTNSVGSRQLRNSAVTTKKIATGAITPAKLSSNGISGSIAMWARISASGTVVASKPHAHTVGWNSVFHSGRISWDMTIAASCFSLATVDGFGAQGFANVATLAGPHSPNQVFVGTFNASGQVAAEPVNLVVICP